MKSFINHSYMKKKKHKKNLDFVFITFREESLGHKDIDHMLPFLYFLNKNDNFEYTARVIIFGNKNDYTKSKDPRIKLLFDLKNVELEFLYEDDFLFKIKRFLEFKSNSIIASYFNGMINKLYIKYLNSQQKNYDLVNKVGKVFIKSKSPLIITLHKNTHARKIATQIKKINTRAKWMVIPHGTINVYNKMTSDTDLDKNKISVDYNKKYNKTDYFLLTSKLDLKIEISQGMAKNKGYVIGSPRYCKEWLKIKSNLKLDGKEVRMNKNYKIRALFCMPKKNLNIFWEELIRTISFISSYKEIELILLNYNSNYPKLPKHITDKVNIRYYLISREYSTSKLIEWADIVFHAGSSVIFEFFMKNKVSVFPRYLSCNTLIHEKYNAGFNLTNRDELRNLCNDAVTSLNRLKKDYKKKCRVSNKKFIDDFIYANRRTVKMNIIKTLSKICDRF